MGKVARISGWALAAFLSVGVALYALRYLYLGAGVAPPPVDHNAAPVPFALIAHAGGAGVALLLGPWQFIAGVRAKAPRVHRWIGRTYIAACALGGLSALVLAPFSAAGPIAQSGFFALGLVWLAATGMAWRAALARDFAAHKDWMLRSFALTFAAVTLRLYIPIAVIADLPSIEAYRAIAWLCWVPNLALMEVWLRTRTRGPIAGARAASS